MNAEVSGPVDVLERAAGYVHAAGSPCLADELTEARAAVEELVESTKAMNALAKGPAGGVSQQQKREVIARVDAALAKFGGAA